MIFLKGLFIVIEVLCCLLLICLILLQKSKKEGLGLAFGASTGETLFGSRAGNVLSKATVILGCVFLVSTLVLGVMFVQKDKSLIDTVQTPAAQPTAQPIEVEPQPKQNVDLTMPSAVDESSSTEAAPVGDAPAESTDTSM